VLLIDEPSIGLSPLVLHKRADDLLADPTVERLFLGGAHAAPAATV
jgi:hypothetical protein